MGHPLRFPIGERYLYAGGGIAPALLATAGLLAGWNRGLQRRVAGRTAELSAALESLRQQTERIQDLYDKAPCGYHSVDAQGLIVEMNDTELRWLGCWWPRSPRSSIRRTAAGTTGCAAS